MAAVTAPSWGAAHEALLEALYDDGSFNRAAGASEAQKFVDTAPRGAVNAACPVRAGMASRLCALPCPALRRCVFLAWRLTRAPRPARFNFNATPTPGETSSRPPAMSAGRECARARVCAGLAAHARRVLLASTSMPPPRPGKRRLVRPR